MKCRYTEEGKVLILILSVGGLGGFIFGYDTGIMKKLIFILTYWLCQIEIVIIAGALPAIIEDYEIVARSTIIQGTITTAILLGSLIGAAFGATLCKILTKKKTIFIIG